MTTGYHPWLYAATRYAGRKLGPDALGNCLRLKNIFALPWVQARRKHNERAPFCPSRASSGCQNPKDTTSASSLRILMLCCHSRLERNMQLYRFLVHPDSCFLRSSNLRRLRSAAGLSRSSAMPYLFIFSHKVVGLIFNRRAARA